MSMNPKYPIYIISKNRWQFDRRLTSRSLDEMGVPYKMIVEHQQYDDYCAAVGKDKVIILPTSFQDEYDVLGNFGSAKSKGSGPARNYAWHHGKESGAKRHWLMDDNAAGFFRLNHNKRYPMKTGAGLRACEDFVDRFKNVPMAGLNYRFFAVPDARRPPIIINSRIYSFLLLESACDFRWRGRYNEDVVLSLDILKAGYCTIQFNAVTAGKAATQTVAGGNTQELYYEGTSPKTDMLVNAHPDVTTKVMKYGRIHHHVDYNSFKRDNKLIPVDPDYPYSGSNNYGMKLVAEKADGTIEILGD